jgi:GNAT superfamily N-acetyltransferase
LHEAVGRTDFTVVVDEQDGRVRGFATVFVPAEEREAGLLDYLAVDSDFRGSGVGSRLFKCAASTVGDRPMLIEVETVGDPPEAARLHRQQFYRRHACRRIVGVPYILPIPTVGKPPMELMIANLRGELTRGDLARWLTMIYVRVYGCDADDPRLEMMLATVPGQIDID